MEVIEEKNKWNTILKDHFNELNDIYFLYEYFELYEKNYKVKPQAIFWEDQNIKIFWSHLVREIKSIEIFKTLEYCDLITPYGYGGPLISLKTDNDNNIKESLKKFLEEYFKYALKQNYITEFIRFHPIFKNYEFLRSLFNVQYLNDTVILDLTQSYDDIWSNMAKKTRYYTKKALNEFSNISIVEKPSNREIDDFLSLYSKTMDKNEASEKYYFSTDFIKDHFKFGTLLIYCKNKDNLLGASAMFLKGKHIMHYHLSATNYFFENSPSRAILWKSIEWAKENSLKYFFFGGGRGKNDSLFQFKNGFSKTIIPFYMGKLIFNNAIYKKLNDINLKSLERDDFFPQYRAGYDKEIL